MSVTDTTPTILLCKGDHIPGQLSLVRRWLRNNLIIRGSSKTFFFKHRSSIDIEGFITKLSLSGSTTSALSICSSIFVPKKIVTVKDICNLLATVPIRFPTLKKIHHFWFKLCDNLYFKVNWCWHDSFTTTPFLICIWYHHDIIILYYKRSTIKSNRAAVIMWKVNFQLITIWENKNPAFSTIFLKNYT